MVPPAYRCVQEQLSGESWEGGKAGAHFVEEQVAMYS